MKKSRLIAASLIVAGLSVAWAGHFTDLLPPAQTAGCVPTANGYDWNCSGDQYSPGGTFAGGITVSTITATGGVGLTSLPIATINTKTPTAAGQLIFCNDCVNGPVCVSSGTGNAAYVSVASSAPLNTVVHCR